MFYLLYKIAIMVILAVSLQGIETSIHNEAFSSKTDTWVLNFT